VLVAELADRRTGGEELGGVLAPDVVEDPNGDTNYA